MMQHVIFRHGPFQNTVQVKINSFKLCKSVPPSLWLPKTLTLYPNRAASKLPCTAGDAILRTYIAWSFKFLTSCLR